MKNPISAGLPQQRQLPEFIVSYFSGQLSIPSGATNTILTLTAPAGKRVRLTHLAPQAANESLTIKVDGVVIMSALLGAGNAQNVIGRQVYSTGSGGSIGSGQLPSAGPGRIVTVEKNGGGSTGQAIYYSYEYGD